MKSWGVRLGMAGVTAVLGVLAIAQAQRDQLNHTESLGTATVADLGPPKPIPADPAEFSALWSAPALSPPAVTRGNDGNELTGGIQQVGHTEANDAGSSFSAPSGNAASPPSLSLSLPPLHAPSLQAPSVPPSLPADLSAPIGSGVAADDALAASAGSNAGNAANPPAVPGSAPSNILRGSGPEATLAMANSLTSSGAQADAALPPAIAPSNAFAPKNEVSSNAAAPSASASSGPAFNMPSPDVPATPPSLATTPPSTTTPPAFAAPAAIPAPPSLTAPAATQPMLVAPAPSTSPSGVARSASTISQPETMIASAAATFSDNKATEPEPGDARLEGAQTPSVMIHRKAPTECKVGQPAVFVIQVRNTGSVTAYQVRVDDQVPRGMRLLDATPQANMQQDHLMWQLGDIEPGGERAINLRLVPETEGVLGSVARVSFEAAASVRTIATRPELRIKQVAPPQVLIGQQLEVNIEVSNPGTGTATAVELQADVPKGLEHPKGPELTTGIGDLQPGETKKLTLRLMATAAGSLENIVRVTSEEGLSVQDTAIVEVTSPQIIVELMGPSRRFLERQANFELAISNQGTAAASNVEIVAYLDRGFTFVSTEFKGQYDESRHAVKWALDELPPGASGTVPLRLLPVEAGARVVRLEATSDLGLRAESEKSITVEALAELTFSVADQHDPIEVGSETTYEIRVTNHGSRDDTNVRLQVELPPGLEVIAADPPAPTTNGRVVSFQPLAHLDAKGEYVFQIKVRGTDAGAHVIRAILTSDASKVPVTKEESTLVYADQ